MISNKPSRLDCTVMHFQSITCTFCVSFSQVKFRVFFFFRTRTTLVVLFLTAVLRWWWKLQVRQVGTLTTAISSRGRSQLTPGVYSRPVDPQAVDSHLQEPVQGGANWAKNTFQGEQYFFFKKKRSSYFCLFSCIWFWLGMELVWRTTSFKMAKRPQN